MCRDLQLQKQACPRQKGKIQGLTKAICNCGISQSFWLRIVWIWAALWCSNFFINHSVVAWRGERSSFIFFFIGSRCSGVILVLLALPCLKAVLQSATVELLLAPQFPWLFAQQILDLILGGSEQSIPSPALLCIRSDPNHTLIPSHPFSCPPLACVPISYLVARPPTASMAQRMLSRTVEYEVHWKHHNSGRIRSGRIRAQRRPVDKIQLPVHGKT